MKTLNKLQFRIISIILSICMFLNGIIISKAEELPDSEGFSLKLSWEEVNNNSVTISNNKTQFLNHSDSDKEIPVRLRISYINEDLMTNNLSYKENELIITVNGLGPALRDGSILPAISIAADKASSTTKKSNWSYTYTQSTDTYTFTNNYPLNLGEPVDGFFEIIWNPNSRDCLNEYNTSITATLRTITGGEVTSNTVTYSNSYIKDEFDVEITSEGLVTTDGVDSLIEEGKTEEDYVWEKYNLYGAFAKVSSLGLKDDLTYYKIWFPVNSRVYNPYLTITDEIKEIDGRSYVAYKTDMRTITPKDKWGNPFMDKLDTNIYVVYPKEYYNPTDNVVVYIDMLGIYNESDGTEELLDTDSVKVNFADNWLIRKPSFGSGDEVSYGFRTIGSFSKYISNHDMQSNKYGALSGDSIKNGGGTAYGELYFKLNYSFSRNSISQFSFFSLDRNTILQENIDNSNIEDTNENIKTDDVNEVENIENDIETDVEDTNIEETDENIELEDTEDIDVENTENIEVEDTTNTDVEDIELEDDSVSNGDSIVSIEKTIVKNTIRFTEPNPLEIKTLTEETISEEIETLDNTEEDIIVETIDLITVNDYISLMTTDGVLRYLSDDEYSMKSVVVPGNVKNLNGFPIEYGIFDCEIYIRKANEDWILTPYTTVKLEEKDQTINLPDNVVSVGFVIKDLTTTVDSKFKVNYQLHLQDYNVILEEGKFVSGFFGYLRTNNENDTSTTYYYGLSEEEYPYNGDYLNDETPYVRDLNTYGRSLYRLTSWNYILRPRSEYVISSNIALDDDVVEGKNVLNMNADIKAIINIQEGADLSNFAIYSLLPEETKLFGEIDTPEDFLDIINFNSNGIDSYYLKQHCNLSIIDNYKNSGRTLLKFEFNFDEPITSINNFVIENISLYSDDNSNIRYFGNTSFRIDSFMTVNEGTGIWYTSSVDNFNGILNDIDNDGDTTEFMAYGYAVDSTYKAYQGILSAQKTVSTSTSNGYVKTDYNTETNSYYNVPSTELDGIYSYKLKMTTDSYAISNLLLYDELEKTNDSTWQGTLEYVDISNVEKIMGITPTIYYTTKGNLNLTLDTLPTDYKTSSDWTTTKPEERVTAIIVDCQGGILKPLDEVYVEVFLKAPNDRQYLGQTTTNIFYSSYNFSSEDGTIINDTLSIVNSNKAAVNLIAPLNKLIIEKIDEVSGEHLSNVTFDLYKEDGTLLKENLITNSAGICTIIGLEDGNYYVVEKSTQNGYVLDTKKWEVTLSYEVNPRYVLVIPNERTTGSVKLVKLSNLPSNKQNENLYEHQDVLYERLDGAIFNLYKVDGTLLSVEKENDYYVYSENGSIVDMETINGEILIKGLPWGYSYYLKEIHAPKGYIINNEEYSFDITKNNVSNVQTIVAMNEQNPAKVIMTKYEMLEDNSISNMTINGAAYSLYLKGDVGDSFLGTYVTDEKGQIIADNLEFGNYYFIETKAANKYQLNPNRIEFTLDGSLEFINGYYTNNIDTSDKRKTGSVNLHKFDAETEESLYKVSFALYKITERNEDGTIKTFYQCDNTGKEIIVPKDGLYYTNTAGNLIINDIYWGEYFIKEYEAAIGYDKTEEIFEFIIDGSKDKLDYDFNVKNNQQKGSISLTKVDEADNTILLPNAEFVLYNTNDKKINVRKENNEYIVDINGTDTLTTNENGIFIIKGLDFGDYYLKETKAPENYGINNNAIRFSVNKINASSIQNLTCEDPQKAIEVTLVKKVKKADIVEAHGSLVYTIEIKDENNNKKSVNLTIDTTQNADENGYIYSKEVISLPMNSNYTFEELITNRYDLVDMNIETSDNGEKMIVTFENTKIDQSYTSDSSIIRNLLQASRKLTSISAIQIGSADDYRLGFKLDDKYIKVYKNYDDGTSEEIPYGDYTLSEDTFTVNGSYTIFVNYTEGNDTYTDDLYLVINGSVPSRLKAWDLSTNNNFTEFHSSTYETKISNVYFKTNNDISEDALISWNVSEDGSLDAYGNPSIIAYLTQNDDGTYNLYLGQDGGVVSGENSLAHLFRNMTALKEIHFIDEETGIVAFDTSKATKAEYMFYNTTNLDSLDVSMLNFSNVKNFTSTFQNVGSTTLTLGNRFDTSSAIYMQNMFDGASNITSLDLGNKFNTSKVVDMKYMFRNCKSITSLDLGDNFNTSKVLDMQYMFSDMSTLSYLDLGDNFDTKNVMNMQYIFNGLVLLQNLDLKDKFDTRNVSNMKYMFNGVKQIKHLDLGNNFNTSNVTNMCGMFRDLGSVDWSKASIVYGDKFDTTNVTDMSLMYQFSRVNEFRQGWMFDTYNVTNFGSMFYMAYALGYADFSHFNFKNATNIGGLLSDTTVCRTVLFGDYMNTNKVTNMGQMFWYNACHNIDLGPRFSTESLEKVINMFGSAEARHVYLGPNPNFEDVIGNITNAHAKLEHIYNADDAFKTLIANSYDVSKVTYHDNLVYLMNDNGTTYDKVLASTADELPIPTKEGYTFEGWYYAKDAGSVSASIVDNVVSVPSDLDEKYIPYEMYITESYERVILDDTINIRTNGITSIITNLDTNEIHSILWSSGNRQTREQLNWLPIGTYKVDFIEEIEDKSKFDMNYSISSATINVMEYTEKAEGELRPELLYAKWSKN